MKKRFKTNVEVLQTGRLLYNLYNNELGYEQRRDFLIKNNKKVVKMYINTTALREINIFTDTNALFLVGIVYTHAILL